LILENWSSWPARILSSSNTIVRKVRGLEGCFSLKKVRYLDGEYL
jgi:hypothetical protein